MMNAKPKDVDSYLKTVPAEHRAALEKVRQMIRAAAPDAVETIAYAMPAYKYKGKPLIYFAASRNHCAIYGEIIVDNQDELAGYDISKGTFRFSPKKPPPATLVKKLVRSRIARIDAAGSRKN